MSEYQQGRISSYVVRAIGFCPEFVNRLVNLYDRIDGAGWGQIFIAGPYSVDLPKAVLARIKSQLDTKLDALKRLQVEQAAREMQEREAARAKQMAEEAAREDQARQEEAERKLKAAEAERKAIEAEAGARAARVQAEVERQQQIGQAKKAEGVLVDRTADCARHQLSDLVKSRETAEVLANVVITLCGSEVSAPLDGGVQVARLERNLLINGVADEHSRETLRSETKDRIVAMAVQARAGADAFAAQSEPTQ